MLVITGATCCGKTELSLELAEAINGEIVSADSMQIYKFMNIGTCKVKDKKNIKHYMIDEIYPDQNFSVAEYKIKAENYINKIIAKNKIPIIVGGTGFYINALLYENIFFNAKPNYKLRNYFDALSDDELKKIILKIDFEFSKFAFNKRKVVRAIEYFYQTGEKFSEYNKKQMANRIKKNILCIVIDVARKDLYENINSRTDQMIDDGLIEETENLLKRYKKDLPALNSIGYKETVEFLFGKLSLKEMICLIKKNTRHYAKRQLTWFRNKCPNALWLPKVFFKDNKEIISYIKKLFYLKLNM